VNNLADVYVARSAADDLSLLLQANRHAAVSKTNEPAY